jgi:hypothetical protein
MFSRRWRNGARQRDGGACVAVAAQVRWQSGWARLRVLSYPALPSFCFGRGDRLCPPAKFVWLPWPFSNHRHLLHLTSILLTPPVPPSIDPSARNQPFLGCSCTTTTMATSPSNSTLPTSSSLNNHENRIWVSSLCPSAICILVLGRFPCSWACRHGCAGLSRGLG